MYSLGETAVQKGYRIKCFREVSSTNTEALAYSLQHSETALWFVAEKQSAGKGRRGRAWQSLEGNLAASLIVPHLHSRQHIGLLSYLCALAVAQTLEPMLEKGRISLKWPNDVLIDERKVAGILIETVQCASREMPVVVCGIGINCAQAPAKTLFPAVSLSEAGLAIASYEVFSTLSNCMASLLEQWNDGQNFSFIRHEWLERAFRLGSPIRVQRHDGVINGIFETVDTNGSLILRCNNAERVVITSGDVS